MTTALCISVPVAPDGWPTAESMVRRVLELYRRDIGRVSDLAAELQLRSDPEAFLGGGEPLPQADLQRLYARAVSHLARSAQVAEGRPPLRAVDWKVILFGLDGGTTLREAIERASDCMEALDGRCGRMTLTSRGELAELRFETMRRQRTPTNCFIDLNGIPQMYGELSWLIGLPIPVLEFALDYLPETYRSLDLPPLPFPLRLDAGWSGFAFPAAFLDYPVVRKPGERGHTSVPASLAFLGGDEVLAPVAIGSRVRALAVDALRRNCRLPAFEEIVASIGCSPATLRRWLAHEGTSYREIRNSCRREIALDLLSRTHLAVEEVARRADFCDSDAFRREFRRWTGETPREYRARTRSANADAKPASPTWMASA